MHSKDYSLFLLNILSLVRAMTTTNINNYIGFDLGYVFMTSHCYLYSDPQISYLFSSIFLTFLEHLGQEFQLSKALALFTMKFILTQRYT